MTFERIGHKMKGCVSIHERDIKYPGSLRLNSGYGVSTAQLWSAAAGCGFGREPSSLMGPFGCSPGIVLKILSGQVEIEATKFLRRGFSRGRQQLAAVFQRPIVMIGKC